MANCEIYLCASVNGVLQTLENCTIQTTQNCLGLQANVPAQALHYCEVRSQPSVEQRSHKSPVQTTFSLLAINCTVGSECYTVSFKISMRIFHSSALQ